LPETTWDKRFFVERLVSASGSRTEFAALWPIAVQRPEQRLT
jgi:hypothetical protein